jgi:hypothetical protein
VAGAITPSNLHGDPGTQLGKTAESTPLRCCCLSRCNEITTKAALHHSTYANGSQIAKSGIQTCDFIYR